MKLQKQVVRKKGEEEYHKWVIILPKDRIKALGWKEGIDLVDELKGDSLNIRPAKKGEILKRKGEPIYEEFKNSIKNILQRYESGLSWSEIKSKLNFSQRAPNNAWVKRLERDIGLIRIKKGKENIWRLEHDVIYTIGYEGMVNTDSFIEKLKNNKIEQVIDVREIPLSRKNGFSKGILHTLLRNVGIRYIHYSELGSPYNLRHQLKTNNLTYEQFFNEFKEHIKDKEIQEKITDTAEISRHRTTVLMCFERDYKKCHRSILAEELINKGWKIIHL